MKSLNIPARLLPAGLLSVAGALLVFSLVFGIAAQACQFGQGVPRRIRVRPTSLR
jgi:hypothetical protein